MGKNINDLSEFIKLIKESMLEKDTKAIAIRDFTNKFIYGEMINGFIEKPFILEVTDRENFCQNLYDILVNEFGEQLWPGYSHSFDGNYEYLMTLGKNIIIYFPNGQEYQDWIFNQIQKDSEIFNKGKLKR